MLCEPCEGRLRDAMAVTFELDLKELREGFGRTQQELADTLGVTQATVSRVEAGKRTKVANLLSHARLLAALEQL